jgi:hypothetical protein
MEKPLKIPQEYNCKFCNYITFSFKDFNKHLNTSKHLNRTILNNLEQNIPKNPKEYKCKICNKCYKARNSLWYHEQKCSIQKIKHDEPTDKEVIMLLIKENSELKNMVMKVLENGTHNTTNNTNTITNTNSHNKAFNLNFFLNETCKNAMNITDFVDSIKLQLTDLMEVGELGYVEGISKIIVKNLNNLDEAVRPIHCTDKKRETMYVKDEGHWEKEDDNKTRLKRAINKVADKNILLLPRFREKYPEYRNSSSKISDIHDKLVIEVMETDDDKKSKIIKNISKATTIKDNH